MAGELSPEATRQLKIGVGMSVFSSAISAYSSYNTAKHNSAMAQINWQHNRNMALENLKLNQYIVGRNKIEMLDASAAESVALDVQELKAKASAEVTQAAYGIKGGSAQQVLHAISRSAEQNESIRLANLDEALFANKVQAFQTESQARDVTGIRPIDSTSGAIQIGSFAADVTSKFDKLFDKIKTG